MESHLPELCDNSSSSNKQQEVQSCSSTSENFNERPLSRNFLFSAKVRDWALDIFRFMLTENLVKEDPFNTLLLKAHYKFASKLMFALFLYVTTFYYADGPLHCIDRHDRSTPTDSFINYCLSYPYTEIAVNGDKNNIDRHYALHYRWIHLVFFILSLIYLLLKKGIKMFHYKELSEMLEKISKRDITESFHIAKVYYLYNRGRHGGMYTKFLVVHTFSLLINIGAFFGLNIGLQNQYWDIPKHLFTERDPESFDDAYSLIFPPFIKCEITVDQYILIDRTKSFGCMLTLMQVYEKIFMLLWVFQVFLTIWNLLFLIMNFPFPYWHKWRVNLLLNNSAYSDFEPFQSFSKKYPISELFALGCVQNLMAGSDYIRLIQICNCNEIYDLNETLYYEESDILKTSSPIGFENLDPIPFFRPNSIASPIKTLNPLLSSQNRRPSGNFELTSRRSIGFESMNETNFPLCDNDTTQFYTPVKDNTYFTPNKAVVNHEFTNVCNEEIQEHVSSGSTKNLTNCDIPATAASDKTADSEDWDNN